MSIWGNISHFVGDIFGGDDEEKKKKQQQQQQQQNRSVSVNRPAPGSVVTPTRQQDSPAQPVQQPDNSIKLPLASQNQQAPQAGSFDHSQPLAKAKSNRPLPTSPSNAEIAARSAGSVAANVAGGATGAVKGLVQLPSAILGIPKLAKIGTAKLTHNDTAAQNAADTHGTLEHWADNYDKLVKPVTNTLTKAETATDTAAKKVAPWQPEVAKTITKAATNLIPVDAAAAEANTLVKANRAAKFAESTRTVHAAADATDIVPGLRSVNPNQAADAARQTQEAELASQHALQPQIDQTVADGKAGDTQRLLSDLKANDPLSGSVRTPQAVMPDGGENFVAPHQVLAAQERASGAEAASIDRTPAFERRAAQNDAALAADQAAAQNADLIDTPAFERRGATLPSETPSVTDINDGLRTNAISIAQDPQVAPLIAHSFQTTGSKNPLSLVMHALSNTTDKNVIRNLVQRLVPGADPNTLNRAVNSITGAEDVTDVSHALTEAAARKTSPLGPISDAPAPVPAPTVAEPMPGPGATAIAPPPEAPPVHATPSVPAAAAPTPHVAPEPVAAPAVETPVAPPAPAPDAPTIPESAPITSGEQVPVAPRFRDATMKQLGDLAKQLPGDGQMRDVTNLEDLANAAKGAVENMAPEELVHAFGAADLSAIPADAKGFAVMRAARDKLSEMLRADPTNTDIRDALVNTMDDMERRASGNGLLQRVVQEDFDTMPVEAKVRYLVKRIDKANADTKNYVSIASDPARQAEVDAVLTARLQASQDIADKISALEGKLNAAAEAATKGRAVETKAITKEIRSLRAELQVKNGEAVKYFQDLVPGRTAAQKALVDFPKRAMLSSFSGRFNDILTTGANVAGHQTDNLVQGVVGGAVNLVKGKGTVSNTFKGGSRLLRGVGTGLKKFAGEVKGNNYVEDMLSATKGNKDLRSGLRKPNGPVSRTIQAATELATNISQGVRDQRIYQLADQEAAKAGLKGKMRKQYAEARAEMPSTSMKHNADEIHKQVNNLNSNPISDTLNKIGEAMEGGNGKFAKSGVGGIIKNQVMPFTSWLGGNVWNSVTDKNVVASTIKFVDKSLVHKDPEAAIHYLSQAIKGGAEGYGIGYLLAKHGYLTDKNAEGYNDAGMYIHVGDRYIPVGMLGFAAPNVVLGKMAHDGLNAAPGENPLEKMAADIGNFAWHGLALGQVLGTDSNISRAIDAGTQKGHNAIDAAATGAAGVVGQFIPALTGDINSGLDNGVPLVKGSDKLNPTHEAADTRAQSDKLTKSGKPSTAKDIPKSSLNGIIARIPVAAQQLPRKAGVAAKDFTDRVVKGDHENGAQIQAKQDAKKEADQTADFKKRDIPNYKDSGFQDAVQARVERGEYDKVIEALQTKVDADTADKNIPAHKVEEARKQITQMRVAKENKLSYDDMKLYNATSVSEWRSMGDSESDTYDPDTYKKLWTIDKALDDAGVAGGFVVGDSHPTLTDKQKYSAKKGTATTSKKSSAQKAADAELNRIQSNTLGDVPKLAKMSLGDLAPQKAASAEIPKIQQIKSSDLIKKRKITVSKA